MANENAKTDEKVPESSIASTSTTSSSSSATSSSSRDMNNSPSSNNTITNSSVETTESFYSTCSSIVTVAVATDVDKDDNSEDQGEQLGKQNSVEKRKYSSKIQNVTPLSISSSNQELTNFQLQEPFLRNNSLPPNSTSTISPEAQSFITSISSKASPFTLKSWIALSLTLDGRDKITKVIQYTSRFLGFYYETLAKGMIQDSSSSSSNESNNNAAVVGSIMYASYVFKAKKFRRLYKALTSSRKAYRFGRTFIEIEKLKSMGFLHWIAWYLRRNMFTVHDEEDDTHDIVEKKIKSQESSISFHPDTKFKQLSSSTCSTNGKYENDTPPRIVLPRRVSSNIGFKPSSFSQHDYTNESTILKRLSSVGRFSYLSLSSFINDDMLVEKYSKNGIEHKKTPPPLWKILSSALKIIGLAGFWTGDNISYLYSIGFLVDDNDPKKIDLGTKSLRRTKAALFATKSYFFASVVGLYHNAREWYNHRHGVFLKTTKKIEEMKIKLQELEFGNDNNDNKYYAEHEYQLELESLEKALEEIKHKHFKICLALLKVRLKKC